jgi:hypothetical protein
MQQWVFSLGSVPVMTCNSRGSETVFSLGSVAVMSCNSRGFEAVFSLGSVHGLYSSGIYGTVAVTSIVQSSVEL